jgi:hypothetical protein
MSMETRVFLRGKLPSKAALSRAMKELGFPYSLKPATGSLEQQNGFMPMLLRREETGVEFDVFGRDAVAEFADAGVDASYERVANFRWAGDFQEAVAGMCGAAALAKLVNGVVFDEAENRLLSVEDAVALARKNLESLPPPPKQRSPRGRTLLKRMLAPLLAKRSDLAVVGDLLVIRPVRHLIRGAQFRWYERQTACSACPFIQPLYQNALFLEDAAFSDGITDPDFAPMLFDRLAAEIFEPLGKIATIEDFVESSWGRRLSPYNLFPSILLWRGVEQTRRDLPEIESLPGFKVAEWQRAFVGREDAEAFAYYKTWETEAVRALKLKDIWEPTPFPAELPVEERAITSADPTFVPTPWLDFPDTWHQDPPEVCGEVRYAGHWWDHRHGRVRLIRPLTREQAEERHRNREGCVVAARLPEGQLLILYAAWRRVGDARLVDYHLWVYGSQRRYMLAEFREHYEDPGVLKMTVIHIRKIDNGYGWLSYLDFDDNETTIHDDRTDEHRYLCRKMTAAERAAYAFPLPRFDEFAFLWERISQHLDAEGFGAFK